MCSSVLAGLACHAAVTGDGETAAVLFAASDAIDTSMGVKPQPVDKIEIERYLAKARADTNAPSWQSAWSRGEAMSIDQAIELAQNRTARG